ncbi:hypothetical protein [Microcystis aeruginosa]|jgi:CRISPR/Cas system CSM-associated protein Csm2 small subunit|uniref:hypothetical protein n=1 Tax=Microcystis aeruginosa TaxID=1126 RepID=UPI001230E193|nr:hypothetical protein [Microcystis aeruginosa]WOB68234.1 hypothetical protein PJW00_22390 [Microcystis aeruginosa LE3]GCA90864.1 hypothetical protein MiTa_04225 [Microcystis aeruginosa NIES-4264]
MSSLFPQSSINSPVRYLKGIKQIVDDINNNCIHKVGEFHRRFWRTLIVPSSTLNVARILWIFQNNSQLHHFRSAFTINWFYVILYTILYVLFWWFFTPVVQDFCVLLRDLLELSKNDNPSNFQLGWRIFVTFLQNQLDSHRVVLIFIVVFQGFLFCWSKTVVTVVDKEAIDAVIDAYDEVNREVVNEIQLSRDIKRQRREDIVKQISMLKQHLAMEPDRQKREEIRREIQQLELKLDQITGHIDSPDDYLLNKSLDFNSLDDDVDWFNQALSNPDYEDGEDEFPLPKI